MPRPKFTLKTMLWVVVCVGCFLAGRESQRRYDEHWFAGMKGLDKYDFRIEVQRDDSDHNRQRTTVRWGDGVVIQTDGGLVSDLKSYFYAEGRATNIRERRKFEEENGLMLGVLDRR